jgi:hypothetical protein
MLYHILQQGAIGSEEWQGLGLTVSTDHAYTCYEDVSKRQHEWRPDRKDLWSKKIRAALVSCVVDTRPNRVRSFQFAPLAKCRRQFEMHVGNEN